MDLSDIASVFSCAATLVLLYWLMYGRFKKSKNLKGPISSPFLGNYKDFEKSEFQLHKLLNKYYTEIHEDIFSFFHCNKEVVVLKDDATIRQVFIKNSDKFKNRQYFIELPSTCDSMITLIGGGKRHQFLRYLLSSLSATSSLKKLYPHAIHASNRLCENIAKASKNGKAFDIESFVQGFKAELLSKISFSLDCPNQSELNKTLVKTMKDFMNPPSRIYRIASLPFGGVFLKYFDGTFRELLKPFIKIATKIVAERKLTPNTDKFEDILQSLLDTLTTQKGKELLTEEIVLAQGLVLLTAVQAQTSFTLTTVLFQIAKHSHVQKRLSKLISNVVSDSEFPTWENLNDPSLIYLDNIIKETQRLFPSIFMLTRECTTSVMLDEKLSFVKGDLVLVPTMSIHMDDRYWDNSQIFNPDRFESSPNPKHYYPFGIGARNCAGYKLALMEIKAAVLTVLSKYELELADPNIEIEMQSNVTVQANMTITSPLLVRAKSR